MILISAHQDKVKNSMDLKYKNGVMTGLLDNFLGIQVVLSTLLSDENLVKLEKNNKIQLWFNKSEEWGELDNSLPEITKDDIALVVDVASNKDYKGYDVVLENATEVNLQDIKEYLEWHGLKVLAKEYTGDEIDEDEAWYFRKLKIPTLTFTIPIQAIDDGWHRIQADNTVSAEQLQINIFALRRLICYFIS